MRISDWSSDVCSSDLASRASARIACSTFDFVAPSISAIVRIGVPSRRRSETLSRNHCSSGRGWSVSDSTSVVSTFPPRRSEEHTSELQSLMRISYAVFCLKKKTKHHIYKYDIT